MELGEEADAELALAQRLDYAKKQKSLSNTQRAELKEFETKKRRELMEALMTEIKAFGRLPRSRKDKVGDEPLLPEAPVATES